MLKTVIRTAFLLTFISDVKLREVIHRSTNKTEEYHNFEDWITFASGGVIRERAYAEQEKRIKYTGITANCVILDNTVEVRAALNTLKAHENEKRRARADASPKEVLWKKHP